MNISNNGLGLAVADISARPFQNPVMKILFAFWVVLFFPVAFSGCYMQSGRLCVLSNVKLVQVDTVWRYNGRKIRLTWEVEGNSLQYVTYNERREIFRDQVAR